MLRARAHSCSVVIERVAPTEPLAVRRAAAGARVGVEKDAAGAPLSIDAILHRDEFRCEGAAARAVAAAAGTNPARRRAAFAVHSVPETSAPRAALHLTTWGGRARSTPRTRSRVSAGFAMRRSQRLVRGRARRRRVAELTVPAGPPRRRRRRRDRVLRAARVRSARGQLV